MPPPSPAGLLSFFGAGFLSPASSLPRLNSPPAFEVRPPRPPLRRAPIPPPSSFLSSLLSREAGDDDEPLVRSDGLTGPDWNPPPPGLLPEEEDEPLPLPPLPEPPPKDEPPGRLPEEDELPEPPLEYDEPLPLPPPPEPPPLE